jgi:hypothetical protein
MFVGKSLMCTSVAFTGQHSYTVVLELFTSGNLQVKIIALLLLVLIGYTVLRTDWMKHLETLTTPQQQEV